MSSSVVTDWWVGQSVVGLAIVALRPRRVNGRSGGRQPAHRLGLGKIERDRSHQAQVA
jgi:hypothetical protein